ISLGNLSLVARVSGWIWDPDLEGPLFWLLTYPFRFLPAASLPLGLNVFAAVLDSLTLGLLERSITLLPHDRTHEQRERERSPFALLSIPNAWVAPVLAVLVCGLQLTF